MSAMRYGTPLILGGRWTEWGSACRQPDLLVRADWPRESPSGPTYVPVDVKHHKVLLAHSKGGHRSALVADPEEPWLSGAHFDEARDVRWRWPDLVQLAHYRRLLEACGFACFDRNFGGIVGSEGILVWYDLDYPNLDSSPFIEVRPSGPLSAMAVYDLEFAYRLKVYEAALAHREDPSRPLLAESVSIDECHNCPWRTWCGARLHMNQDLSLLPRMNVVKRRHFMRLGVSTIGDLARLDYGTAELVANKVDLTGLIELATGLPEPTALQQIVPRRRKQLTVLADAGLTTVGDLARLDQKTVAVSTSASGDLSELIDLARARLGSSPAYKRRGVSRIVVPRADIEIDVDMESAFERCYLWGTLKTDHRVRGSAPEYRSFCHFNGDSPVRELGAFASFWDWLQSEREDADREGAILRAYCYSKGAEGRYLKSVGAVLGRSDEVNTFTASDQWVDLREIVRGNLITGGGLGLKAVALLSSFAWRADEVGGDLAMVRYDEAIDTNAPESVRVSAQQWILQYNEDDCAATAALREWLDAWASLLPSIEDLTTEFTPPRSADYSATD